MTTGDGGGWSDVEVMIWTWSVSIWRIPYQHEAKSGGSDRDRAAHASTHPLHHPPPLAPEHLALFDPPLPRPERTLEHHVPNHSDPEHGLALLEADPQGVEHSAEREEDGRVAQDEMDRRMDERRGERLVDQVLRRVSANRTGHRPVNGTRSKESSLSCGWTRESTVRRARYPPS